MPNFSEWNSFYVIVGSAAGALIGLQFVVMTLVRERPHRSNAELGSAFATPSVVHFTVVLLLSAIVSMPWHGIVTVSTLWGLAGFSGIVYSVIVAGRMRVQTVYRPVLEDWLFHAVLPLGAYGMLAASAFVARSHVRQAQFLVAGCTLLLLFVGIHNAWDAVTFHVLHKGSEKTESERQD